MATAVVAIDPGPKESAWVLLVDGIPTRAEIETNDLVLAGIRHGTSRLYVFERVASMGKTVGASTFETVFWTGRFFQQALERGATASRISRMDVKRHLLNSVTGTDGDIRRALLQRFGYAVGERVLDGPLVGITTHKWQALAVGVTWWDRAKSSGAV